MLTWPNTTANGGILAVDPNHLGLVFDMRDYRGKEGQSYFSVVTLGVARNTHAPMSCLWDPSYRNRFSDEVRR